MQALSCHYRLFWSAWANDPLDLYLGGRPSALIILRWQALTYLELIAKSVWIVTMSLLHIVGLVTGYCPDKSVHVNLYVAMNSVFISDNQQYVARASNMFSAMVACTELETQCQNVSHKCVHLILFLCKWDTWQSREWCEQLWDAAGPFLVFVNRYSSASTVFNMMC